MTTSTPISRCIRRKEKLLVVLEGNISRMIHYAVENKDSLSSAKLSVLRSMYRQHRDVRNELLSLVEVLKQSLKSQEAREILRGEDYE